MDDESISDKMLAITVSEAKQWIKDRKLILNIYNSLNHGKFTKINKQQFTVFAKTFVLKMTDFEASELFNYLVNKSRSE